MPVIQNVKTGNDVTEPIRVSNGVQSSDRQLSQTLQDESDQTPFHTVPKASNTAEHTNRFVPCPSRPKRFRCTTFGPVCSCLNFQMIRQRTRMKVSERDQRYKHNLVQ